ncbi:hypothetical protein OLT33_09300 [Campylobacter jejuni]|nr:hypothetical protein [Campylobacter jejuni]MCW1685167.1 hypothetical protein [Campylobacter jejuni]
MKNVYFDIKTNIENLQNIFKNTNDKDEKLKNFNENCRRKNKM